MTPNLLAGVFNDLWDDLKAPTVLWQIGAIVLSCVLGWCIARLIRRASSGNKVQHNAAVQIGIDSFARALSSLSMLAVLALAKLLLEPWQHVNLLRLAIALLASLVVIRFGFYVLRRSFMRGGRLGTSLALFEKVFALLVWLAVALYITGAWPDLLKFLDDTQLPLGRNKVSLMTIVQALATVVVMVFAALWAGAALEQRLMQIDGMHTSLRVVMARTGRTVLVLVAVLLSLSMVGIDLTVLSVFGGALGVGLGLGLQKIASNYVSGFVILLDRSLAIGDMISVDKFYGKVTQINTRYTVLQGLDGVESVIPNEMLLSSPVQNYCLSNSALRVATQFSVSYDTDMGALLPRLEAVTAGVARVIADPPPSAQLKQFGADGINLEIGFWIDDPENGRGNVTSDVNMAIWTMMKEQGISMPFPQREVRIVDDRVKPDPLAP